ncbi:MAG: type II toxin-antitoxin system RelE/ParE family toxin [Treponema sp.]|jgi:plasmid stabilization system protein ParE|nr:type II toxin-antitoxin system RelE/ParE family toxin [Treponema sp.]
MEPERTVYHAIIAPAVYDRMYEHFTFLARVSESAARRLLDTFMKDIRSLVSMPFAYPPYDRVFLPKGKYRYMLSGKRYRIVYQVVDDAIYVDDVQDCRQDNDKNLI